MCTVLNFAEKVCAGVKNMPQLKHWLACKDRV